MEHTEEEIEETVAKDINGGGLSKRNRKDCIEFLFPVYKQRAGCLHTMLCVMAIALRLSLRRIPFSKLCSHKKINQLVEPL